MKRTRQNNQNRHGGNLSQLSATSGRPATDILDFSANINPLGFPEWFRPLVSATLSDLVNYPDPSAGQMVSAVCKRYGTTEAEVICANGTAEIIALLPVAAGFSHALIPVPAYVDYAHSCHVAGIDAQTLRLVEENDFNLDFEVLAHTLASSPLFGKALVFICRPNNPTGQSPNGDRIRQLARDFPESLFVIDEAFGDFVENFDTLARNRPENVIVLLSLTKIFALPGLRMGVALADPKVIRAISRRQPCWSVNTLSQVTAARALADTNFIEKTREYVVRERQVLASNLSEIERLFVYPGEADFLFIRIDRTDIDSPRLAAALLEQAGIAIRVCDNYEGLDQRFFRVAVKTGEENERLVSAIRNVLNMKPTTAATARKRTQKTPVVMFQGTSSNAGKSIMAAALCRILLQDGLRVAPFKAQNMSLNSFVTRDGGEMGRAQVVQAQAAKIDPDVRMNPVLLKPSSDTGSQVIVNGFPIGNMNVMTYVRYKETAAKAARDAYDELSGEYDAVVMEGAGSPGEVNLKHHDIVNMKMARHAAAPVLIVGDIDRGGVFASFVGTMEVLAEWERQLVAGFVVNRFRGDAGLLGDALEYTRRHTGRPVIGVVPYLESLGLPEEDSVTLKEHIHHKRIIAADHVRIGVIELPHISNFTDFDPFLCEDDVDLRFIRVAEEINGLDAIILPGSKNVMADVRWLHHNRMAGRILNSMKNAATEKKTQIAGICGGFQMLGRTIEDPHHIESSGETVKGLGLLNITTVLEADKTLTRTAARHLKSNTPVTGYEIHHGISRLSAAPLLETDDGRTEGACSEDAMIWGTYLHGIFDGDRFRRWFINELRRKKGLAPKTGRFGIYDLEPAFDRLAATVRESLDIKQIYKWMGL